MTQHPKRVEHMLRRRAADMKLREIGDEFDLTPQHVGRLIRAAQSPGGLTRTPLPCDYDKNKQTEEG